MGEPEEPKEQEFEILEDLAKIKDVGDFRLLEFMRQHGMNPNQPVIFYRELIKEIREIISFLNLLQETIDTDFKAIAQLKAKLLPKEDEIKALKAKLRRLEEEVRKKLESIEKERGQLKTTASQLDEKAKNYDDIKDFLKGRTDTETVGALYRLVENIHMEMLYTDIGMQSPPNLARLESIKQKMRDDLMEVLQIPKDTLELDNIKLKERVATLEGALKLLARGGGYRAT